MTVKKTAFFLISIFITGLCVLLIILQIGFWQRFFFGIKLSNVNLGGKTYYNTFLDFGNLSQKLERSQIIINEDQRKFIFPASSVDLDIDTKTSLDSAWRVGRDKNPILALYGQLAAIFGNYNIPLSYTYNQNKLDQKIQNISLVAEKLPIEPQLIIAAGQISVKTGEDGKKIDRLQLKADLDKKIKAFESTILNLPTYQISPQISNQTAKMHAANLKNLVGKKIILFFGDKKWEIDDAQIVSLLSFEPQEEPLIKLANFEIIDLEISNIPSQDPESDTFINDQKLVSLIANIAAEIEENSKDAVFVFENGKVSTFQPAVEGKKVDRRQLQNLFGDAIFNNSKSLVEIAIPVTLSQPQIKTADVNNLGIKELIGKGVSNFSGSAKERIHNIRLAASKINGTLVAPGEIFSFNQVVGEISASSGYTSAYIISKGRTILGEGGGVCQVSTTVFRAAIFSGLEVIERHAHAYRVSYYEQGGHKVGLDATIYSPNVDFKFRNDTGNYILIQSYIKGSELHFDFYGTKDGRTVTVSNPQVVNIIPAPEPNYENDPSLPVGVKKQIDFSAVGASVTVNRTVEKNGQVIYQNSFFSRYRPWQAIFKVGTGGQV